MTEELAANPPAARASRLFWVLLCNVLALAVVRPGADLGAWSPAFGAWATIVVAIVVQAVPFLVLGVVLSALIAALVPAGALARALPRRTALAVPVAGLAGAVLPGCECSSVPLARRLIAQGVPTASAVTFLLAAPAINPVVLVSTAVAFPGQPRMVLARFLASLGTAVVVGLLWSRIGRDEWLAASARRLVAGESRWSTFAASAEHDLLHAGGFLVVGAATAATLKVVVPAGALDAIAGHGAASILAMAGLAVALAVCSEADAFVAASLTRFSPGSKLVFLVVGPMVDVKLVALQAGVLGRAFAARFAPLTLAVAVAAALLTARMLL